MTKGKLIDISNKIDSINTFESYSDTCYLNENSLLVPYIKLELIDQNVIGNIDDRINIDFSYLIFDGLKEIHWIGENELKNRIVGRKKLAERKDTDLTNWIAINRKTEGFEIKAIFEKLLIFIPLDSPIGKEWWSHIKTPDFQQNIKQEIANEFFDLRKVPESLAKVLELSTYTILSFDNGNKNEIEFIKNTWAEY